MAFRSSVYALICLLVILQGCRLFEELTGPEESKLPEEQTVTIDERGGTIEVEGFSVSIPAGALTQESTVGISVTDTPIAWPGHLVSSIYQLEGLPKECSKPLTIRIRYQRDLQESSLICRSVSGISPCTGNPGNVHRFLPAMDSAGYLIATLPALPGDGMMKSGDRSNGKSRQTFAGLTGYIQHTSQHFRITLPGEWDKTIKTTLAEILERNHKTIGELGFTYTGMPKTPWDVYMIPFTSADQKRYCMFIPEPDLHLFNYVFDEPKVRDMASYYYVLCAAGGREFFHSVLSTYDTRYFKSPDGTVEPARFWWHHAVASWAEEKFITYPDGYTHPLDFEPPISYDPAEIVPLAPFRGIQAGSGQSEQTALKHGGGMAVFVKYLVEQYGKQVLTAIYERIREGDYPVNAIKQGVESTDNAAQITQWWPEFFKAYMSNKLYGVDDQMFMDASEETFTITSEQTTSAIFTKQYPDLSTRIYRVQLKYDDLSPDADLQLSLTGQPVSSKETMLLVYKYQSSPTEAEPFQFVEQAIEQITISNVRTFMDQGFGDLLVVVVNSHADLPEALGMAEMTLEMNLLETQVPQFNRCTFDLIVSGEWGTESSTREMQERLLWQCEGGDFTDNTYRHTIETSSSGEIQGYKYGTLFNRDLQIEFDPNDFTITGITATLLDSNYSDLVADNRRTVSFVLQDCEIPVTRQGQDLHGQKYIVCKIQGDEVCIQHPDIQDEAHTYDRDGVHTWLKLLRYSCNTESKLSVQFWKEEP